MKKFEICLWVHTDIDEPDTTFILLEKSKEDAQKQIDYINKNCLSENHRMEIVSENEDDLIEKAEKWDKLEKAVYDKYTDESGQYDLTSIGEDCMKAFELPGW